ncbi:unnamed protein product [Boreogadus saida]
MTFSGEKVSSLPLSGGGGITREVEEEVEEMEEEVEEVKEMQEEEGEVQEEVEEVQEEVEEMQEMEEEVEEMQEEEEEVQEEVEEMEEEVEEMKEEVKEMQEEEGEVQEEEEGEVQEEEEGEEMQEEVEEEEVQEEQEMGEEEEATNEPTERPGPLCVAESLASRASTASCVRVLVSLTGDPPLDWQHAFLPGLRSVGSGVLPFWRGHDPPRPRVLIRRRRALAGSVPAPDDRTFSSFAAPAMGPTQGNRTVDSLTHWHPSIKRRWISLTCPLARIRSFEEV